MYVEDRILSKLTNYFGTIENVTETVDFIKKIDLLYMSDIIEHFSIVKDKKDLDQLTTESSKLICRMRDCRKRYTLIRMRNHVGKHILNKKVTPNVHQCGFCGEIGCSIAIRVTSGYGVNKTYGPDSDCKYSIRFSLKIRDKIVDSYPCTNRPVKCDHCSQIFWSYNLELHYSKSHPGIFCPSMISDEERRKVISSK